jgi:hypothetical protein
LSHQTCRTATQFVIAKGSLPLKRKSEDGHHNHTKKQKLSHNLNDDAESSPKKRKYDDNNDGKDDDKFKKRQRLEKGEGTAPPGTQWDGVNYSCAYDALFTILYGCVGHQA